MVYHSQIQTDSFLELKQATEKNASSLQHLLERASSLKIRMTNAEKSLASLDQQSESLDKWRDCTIRKDSKLEQLEIQDMKKMAELTKLSHIVDELQLEVGMKTNSSGTIHSRLAELEHSMDRSLTTCLDQEMRIKLLE